MNVIHIVPAAFEYFEDIRSGVFRIVEELDRQGIFSEIITLQYGSTGPSSVSRQTAVRQKIPRNYQGTVSDKDLFDSFKKFDIIHLHLPGLGFLGKFVAWQRNNPAARVVITYYRPVRIVDTISLFIRWYNTHYLPKIFTQARGLIFFSEKGFFSFGKKINSEIPVVDAQPYISWPLSEKTNSFQFLKLTELGQYIIALYEEILYT